MSHAKQTSDAPAKVKTEHHGSNSNNSCDQRSPPDRTERVNNSVAGLSIHNTWPIKHGNMVSGFRIGRNIFIKRALRARGARERDYKECVCTCLAVLCLKKLNHTIRFRIANPSRKFNTPEDEATDTEADEGNPKRIMYRGTFHAA